MPVTVSGGMLGSERPRSLRSMLRPIVGRLGIGGIGIASPTHCSGGIGGNESPRSVRSMLIETLGRLGAGGTGIGIPATAKVGKSHGPISHL